MNRAMTLDDPALPSESHPMNMGSWRNTFHEYHGHLNEATTDRLYAFSGVIKPRQLVIASTRDKGSPIIAR